MDLKLLIFLVILSVGRFQRSDEEASWEFINSTSNWIASAEENDMELYIQGGELRGSIIGSLPHIDSPRLSIDTSVGHSVVIRMMYTGQATNSRLLYRSGYFMPDSRTEDHSRSLWGERMAPKVIGASSNENTSSLVVDGDSLTSWIASSPQRESLTFDLGETRSVTSIYLQSSGVVVEGNVERNANPNHIIIFKGDTKEGPYKPVRTTSFPSNTTFSLTVDGLKEFARYWRVQVVDGFGDEIVGLREVVFQGLDQGVATQDFDLTNDGQFHTYYLPVKEVLMGRMTQMRLVVAQEREGEEGVSNSSVGASKGESMAIDYIRIIKAPIINKVSGCVDVFAENPNFDPLYSNVSRTDSIINQYLRMTSTEFHSMSGMEYGKTYNCVREGGQKISVEGIDFGDDGAVVTVDGKTCSNVQHFPGNAQGGLTCILPDGIGDPVNVKVANGRLTGLFDEKPYLSYAAPPLAPNQPQLSNLGATSVDISWTAPTNYLNAVIITGYVISTQEVGSDEKAIYTIVGNITTTTVKGLKPGTEYITQVAALNENQTDSEWTSIDLYGRREMLDRALISTWSPPTDITATLVSDITYNAFDANSTLNHSSVDDRMSLGPTGVIGGEGAYGLNLVGDANVENCNGSFLCCDGFDYKTGSSSCIQYACSAIGRINQAPVINDLSKRNVPNNLDGGEKVVKSWEEFAPMTPSIPCGPALRLTASFPRQSGATWYARQMNVREGFDTTFSFRISNPSYHCNSMQDVYTMCRSRGADGLAFVIQNQSPTALGEAGKGLGYEGIDNSLAVEFDTFFNYDNLDAYENHISVQTRGWRLSNNANHSFSLASSVRTPELAEGIHTARIKYTPVFDTDASMDPYFTATSWTTEFLQNADAPNGGMPDWGTGIGMMYVYVDNLVDPLFITPLNLDSTLQLNNGKAWVGFTAATGQNHYQVHDMLSWSFTQLYVDPPYDPPPVVNEDGAYTCQSQEDCVHP